MQLRPVRVNLGVLSAGQRRLPATGEPDIDNPMLKEPLMIRSMQFTRLVAAALVTFALAACANQKDPAQQALADLDAALGKVAEIGEKYMPEEYTRASGCHV